MRSERVGLGVGLAILAVLAVLRLDATPLWQDEAYTLGALNGLGSSVQGTHGTMAIYYVVLWCWSRVSTATWWLRAFSVLCAAATLVVLRPLARRVGGPRLVLIALPLVTLGAMFAWKATEARSYALETLLTTTCWYVVVRAQEVEAGEDLRWFAALVPLSVAGVLCHGFFVAQLVPLGLVALLGPRPRRTALLMLPTALASAGVLAWLVSSGISNVGTTVTGGLGAVLRTSLSGLFSSYTGLGLLLVALAVYGAAHLVQLARARQDARQRVVLAMPWAWSFVPWATLVGVWLVEPRFNPRYLAPVLPGLALLLGSAALALDDALAARARPQRRSAPPRVVTLVVGVVAVVSLLGAPPFVREDWRGAARLVATSTRPGDGIVFVPDDVSRPPFEAAWREVRHPSSPKAVSPARPLGRVHRYDDDLPLAEVGAAAQGCARVWVVEYVVSSSVTDRLAREPGFARRFRSATRVELADDIVVTLFVERDPAVAPVSARRC